MAKALQSCEGSVGIAELQSPSLDHSDLGKAGKAHEQHSLAEQWAIAGLWRECRNPLTEDEKSSPKALRASDQTRKGPAWPSGLPATGRTRQLKGVKKNRENK